MSHHVCTGVSKVGQDIENHILETHQTHCTDAKEFPTLVTPRTPLLFFESIQLKSYKFAGNSFLTGTCFKGRLCQKDTIVIFCIEDVD